MQKTEKHCKNQCFCYHKTTKISPKTGPKTQKSASGPGHLRNRKKRCCKPKNWGQKVEKHGVFSLFACRFWTGAFTNRCLPYCFLQCFLKASVTTYQKQEVLAEKWDPPPGKPVTFYECHPDDHAPAPSVRADFFFAQFMFVFVSACADLVYWNLYSGIHGCYIGYYISSKLNWKAGFQSNLIILSELSWYLLQVTILFFAHFLSLCHFSRISAAVKVFIA